MVLTLRPKALLVALACVVAAAMPAAAQVTIPYTFVFETTIDQDQVNSNFTTLGNAALNRAGGTVTGTLTSSGGGLAGSWAGAPTLTGAWVMGTPASVTLTNGTGLPLSTGLTGGGTGVLTALGVNIGTAGAFVVNGGALGTPSSGTLTSVTGLPISTGLTGAGTGVLTALGVNVGSAGAVVVNGGALGTPSSGTLTNATGLPVGSITGLGTNVATWLATPSSANLLAAITDETGSGVAVFGTSPTIATPTITTSMIVPLIQGVLGADTYSFRPSSNYSTYAMTVDSSGAFYPGTDNTITLGKSGKLFQSVWAANTTIQTSDERFKKDRVPSLGLDFVLAVEPFGFRRVTGSGRPDYSRHFGFSAQQVGQELSKRGIAEPWMVQRPDGPDSKWGLAEGEMIAPIVKAIQELSGKVVTLEGVNVATLPPRPRGFLRTIAGWIF